MPSDAHRDSDNLRNDSEDFRTVPQPSEAFRTVPNDAEARERYTLTVREVARMFEDAGVARTERSVTNWCRQDASGSSRLNCRYDHNERKYFITPESVERAIQEELAKLQGAGRQEAAPGVERTKEAKGDPEEVEHLRQRVQELQINDRVKSQLLKQLGEERELLLDRIAQSSRLIGQLETKVELLGAPGKGAADSAEVADEGTDTEVGP